MLFLNESSASFMHKLGSKKLKPHDKGQKRYPIQMLRGHGQNRARVSLNVDIICVKSSLGINFFRSFESYFREYVLAIPVTKVLAISNV